MKKFLFVVFAALLILVPVSVYAYENQSDFGFDWMPHSSMHERHHEYMDEWTLEEFEDGELTEGASWHRNHHEKMNEYSGQRRFGCHR